MPLRSWTRRAQMPLGLIVLLGLAGQAAYVAGLSRQGKILSPEEAVPQEIAFRVDVNTADLPELAQLPGIGETLGRRIVQSRESDGPFVSAKDLQRVKGIGPKTVARLERYVVPLRTAGRLAKSP